MTQTKSLVPEQVRRAAYEAIDVMGRRRPVADIEYDSFFDEADDGQSGRQIRFRTANTLVTIIVTSLGDLLRVTILVTPPARWVVSVRNVGAPSTGATYD